MEKLPGSAFWLLRTTKAPSGCDISVCWASLRFKSSWYQLESRRDTRQPEPIVYTLLPASVRGFYLGSSKSMKFLGTNPSTP